MMVRPTQSSDTGREAETPGARTPSLVYVTLTSGRARPHEDDAIIALHEDWALRRSGDAGLLSSEILVDPADPRTFIAISHFVNQAAAERSLSDPEHTAWRRRLASLSEAHLTQRDWVSQWRASALPSAAPTQPARREANGAAPSSDGPARGDDG
jgi:quinol monooxygenase YgiN